MTLGDYLSDISYNKKSIIDCPGATDEYIPYVINEVMSRFSDCIFFVNEVNKYPDLNKKAHFKYLMNSISKRKRFDVFDKPVKHPDHDLISEYYKYSYRRTCEALELLTDDQIEEIRQRMDKGGLR